MSKITDYRFAPDTKGSQQHSFTLTQYERNFEQTRQ